MKRPKIVILRGRPTSGKTTALRILQKRKEMKDWIVIDSSRIDSPLGKKFGMHELLKDAMKTGKDILVDETSKSTLRKYIYYHIKKHNYQLKVFQFHVSTKTAYKRDIQRARDGWHPGLGKKKIKELHDYHDKKLDKKATLVDTDKLGKR